MSDRPPQLFTREFPGDLLTPVSAFLRLRPLGARFLLESVEGGERSSRYSILGLGARCRIWADSDGTWLENLAGARTDAGQSPQPRIEPARLAGPERDPLDCALKAARALPLSAEVRDAAIPCLGPLVGYIGYDYVRRLERIGAPPAGAALPEILFEQADELLVFDHLLHGIRYAALIDVDARPAAEERFRRVQAALEAALSLPPRRSARPRLLPQMSDEAYRAAVERLQEHIRAGDIFQAVLSVEMEVHDAPPMFDIYRALRRVNPSPYMFFMEFPGLTIAGSSPESSVKLDGRRASIRPIAGTRPRGRDDAEDQRLEAELRADAKERAEHAMLVDLARNDLSRVATDGSVRVRDYARVERFSHVMHLVSDVECELHPGCGSADLIRATFPAGTVSGAPKIRAMQLIDACESTRRNLYAGCAGYILPDRALDLALMIRTAFRAGDRTVIRAGAGVVAGSTPQGELNECRAKLAALQAAICGAAGAGE